MVGNHDTPSIWRLARAWQGTEMGAKQAAYLAGRLGLPGPEPLAADPVRLVHAKVADLFLGPARNVQIFFADLFGLEETYNMPGTVSPDNWTLRVPADFAAAPIPRLNLPACLALALRSRRDVNRPELLTRLDALAGWRADKETR
jgi:4-alpha-glucanotransferase